MTAPRRSGPQPRRSGSPPRGSTSPPAREPVGVAGARAAVRAIATLPPASAAASESSAADQRLTALASALESVGDRWSLLLVAGLLDGPRRFGDLQTRVQGIAPNVLSQRLRQLEAHGLVVAQPYSERPPRFEYELTGAGQELAGTLRMLSDWGGRHAEGAPEAARHAACGTPLEARWYCPTCQEAVEEPGGDDEVVFV